MACLVAGSSTQASNLCFTQQALSSFRKDMQPLLAMLYGAKTWTDMFDIYLRISESKKSKPLKQLLIALERNLAKNPSQSVQYDLVAYITSKTWRIISMKDDVNAVKPALQALRHFLAKSVVRAPDIISRIQEEKGHDQDKGRSLGSFLSSSSSTENSRTFLSTVMHWLGHPDTAPITGRLISFFCRSLRLYPSSSSFSPNRTGDDQPIWLSALKSLSKTQSDLVDPFDIHVLPEIMHQDREGQEDLISTLPLQHLRNGDITEYSSEDLRIYLMILRGSKGSSLDDVIDRRVVEDVGARLLCHASIPVRTAAFSIVTQPPMSKEPFAENTLTALRSALPAYHTEANPKVRQENLSMMRNLLQRLARSLNYLNKMKSFEDESSGSRDPASGFFTDSKMRIEKQQQYMVFIEWHADFLVQELGPSVSYQRHFVALKVLDFLLTDGQGAKYKWDEDMCLGSPLMAPHVLFGDEALTSVLNLIMDPFDDIRELAASISHRLPGSTWSGLTSKMISKLQEFNSTTSSEYCRPKERPLDTRGTFLSHTLHRATLKMQDTGRADHADGFGRLYDLVLGSHGAWNDDDESIFDHLLSRLEQCIEIAQVNVQIAVKTASLHGYLVAASVWEAVKGILCADAPEGYEVENQDDEVVGTKDLLSFCWRALKESSLGDGLLDTVIRDLQAIAITSANDIDTNEEILQLPQVHAFNCLKDVFTDGRLGSFVEQHMSSSLEIAARALEGYRLVFLNNCVAPHDQWVDGLCSFRWAIRNCGLMLMKALITRLNDGTNANSTKASSSHRRLSTLVYEKYPNLPNLILQLLTIDDEIEAQSLQAAAVGMPESLILRAQRVFPALEMIEQSGIPERHRGQIRQAVWSHLEGMVWPIRDKAAKALSYLPAHDEIEREMESSLQMPWSTQNALHGRLLYLRHLFARLGCEATREILVRILDHFSTMITSNDCPITRAAYTALVGDVLEAAKTDSKSTEYFKIIVAPKRWQALIDYVSAASSRGPEATLENTAKERCRVLLESFNDGDVESSTPDITQTIFVDHGASVPRNPEHADQVLKRTGDFLVIQAVQAHKDQIMAIRQMISCWSKALRLAQDENANVSTRQAAVDSLAVYLARIHEASRQVREAPEMLDLYFVLYDTLNDDDEDVRDTGAAVVSSLRMQDQMPDNNGAHMEMQISLMVPAARHQLLEMLKTRYYDSTLLWERSFERLIYVTTSTSRQLQPGCALSSSPTALLESLSQENITLFVEEKQNLYVDEAQEARTWQNVLLSSTCKAIGVDILQRLYFWTVKGIEALVRTAIAKGPDGPLGWTSNPDVFALGVRILLAAEVLAHLSTDKNLNIDRDSIRVLLSSLSSEGKVNSLNPAWLRMITNTLKVL
ncbi:MAG: hypothetical protein LQ350_004996 [Teloschistes chrysophthalmus]|nr:MAG: hypothetical protein LQ350_004996 [Niorma chrysophthalma]